MDTTHASVVYPALAINTMISRAWQLLRANLRDSLTIMIIPTLLLAVFSIIAGIPAGQTFLTPAPQQTLAVALISSFLGLLSGLVYFVSLGFASCALARLYYSAIVQDQPFSVKECWQFAFRIKWRLLLVMSLFLGCIILFAALDFIILFAGMAISMAAFGVFGSFAALMQSPLMAIMVVFFLLVWGFTVLTVMIALVTVEVFSLAFPFMALATAPEPDRDTVHWSHRIGLAYRLMVSNLPRLVVFALALFIFATILSIVLNGPALLWMGVEMGRLDMPQQHYIPMHVNVIVNIWGSLVQLLLMPFYISAITLFWYDCRVRREGLDLRIWFGNLVSRRGGSLEAYPLTSV